MSRLIQVIFTLCRKQLNYFGNIISFSRSIFITVCEMSEHRSVSGIHKHYGDLPYWLSLDEEIRDGFGTGNWQLVLA